MLIGNKSDLEDKRAVKSEEATQFAETEGLGFIETSAKENINIEEVFGRLANEIMEKMEKLETEEKNAKKEKEKNTKKEEKANPIMASGGGESIKITDQKRGGDKAQACPC